MRHFTLRRAQRQLRATRKANRYLFCLRFQQPLRGVRVLLAPKPRRSCRHKEFRERGIPLRSWSRDRAFFDQCSWCLPRSIGLREDQRQPPRNFANVELDIIIDRLAIIAAVHDRLNPRVDIRRCIHRCPLPVLGCCLLIAQDLQHVFQRCQATGGYLGLAPSRHLVRRTFRPPSRISALSFPEGHCSTRCSLYASPRSHSPARPHRDSPKAAYWAA